MKISELKSKSGHNYTSMPSYLTTGLGKSTKNRILTLYKEGLLKARPNSLILKILLPALSSYYFCSKISPKIVLRSRHVQEVPQGVCLHTKFYTFPPPFVPGKF